jgi:hypothetical protein
MPRRMAVRIWVLARIARLRDVDEELEERYLR